MTPQPVPKDFVPSPQSTHALYQVNLSQFNGPLDLLMFLIKRHTLDIFDIPIAFICARYLECLQAMEVLSLDVAAEFMSVAAELMLIKSKVLLPQLPDDAEGDDQEEDPRALLVARLLEYQKFQAAADTLETLDRLGRDVFARPAQEPVVIGPAPLREASVFALVQAFNSVLRRQEPEVSHRVVVEHASLHKRMNLLIESLAQSEMLLFAELFGGLQQPIDRIINFLAVLELARLKLLRLMEGETGELFLQPRFDSVEAATHLLTDVQDTFK